MLLQKDELAAKKAKQTEAEEAQKKIAEMMVKAQEQVCFISVFHNSPNVLEHWLLEHTRYLGLWLIYLLPLRYLEVKSFWYL